MNETHHRRETVVVIDDTDVSTGALRRDLVAEGYAVSVAHDGPSGLQTVRRSPPDLLKSGPLTPEEFEVMKCHTTAGEVLCADFRALRPVRPIIRHHHERLNGSGHPDGLVGDSIPLVAQIVGVVDVFDALMTVRPYKPALAFEAAVEVLRDEAARGVQVG